MAGYARVSPPLVRQDGRRFEFVQDSAAHIIQVAVSGASAPSLVPLKAGMQETLRRSRTTYSLLPVKLFDLIRITHRLPTLPSPVLLASKYLHDRSRSARTGGQISGLSMQKVNATEMAFLTALNWRLHMPGPTALGPLSSLLNGDLVELAGEGESARYVMKADITIQVKCLRSLS
ncbi:MAG: hypothetical protein M1826_003110 [Phylliscum demangeonii]|nr:MAG: hypothetical protein M1826_003110 [Phylliscum demangeonii]